jgi:hypothetical protein
VIFQQVASKIIVPKAVMRQEAFKKEKAARNQDGL